MALVAVAEVLDDVGRPLVGLGEQDAVGVLGVDGRPDPAEEVVRLGEVLAVGALPLVEVGHGVEAEAVEAEVEPEAKDVEHRLLDLGLLVVEVGLVGEEAMPVVGAGRLVPGPVGRLGVEEDDPGVAVAVVRVRPDVPVALGRVAAGAGLLEPRVVGGGVVHDEVGDHADAALVGGVDEQADVLERPVVGVDLLVVGDVVAAVTQGRPVHRQEPDAVDPEPLEVVELLGQPAEVAGSVGVAVVEAADVDLVEDRRLEPERVRLEPLGAGRGRRDRSGGHQRAGWRRGSGGERTDHGRTTSRMWATCRLGSRRT